LLRAFLDAAKIAGGGKDFDPEAFEQRLLENIRREAVIARPDSPAATSTRERARQAALRRARERAQTTLSRPTEDDLPFPSEEEARPVLDDLRTLSTGARARLRDYVRDKAAVARGEGPYEGF